MSGQKKASTPVRIIGSRELHQNLPSILNELQNDEVRYVLTVHGKPRAVLVGAIPFLQIASERAHPSETLVELQLSALMGSDLDEITQGSGASNPTNHDGGVTDNQEAPD